LNTLLDVCRPRIESWKETILDAIGRCWVDLVDKETTAMQSNTSMRESEMTIEIKMHLQKLCIKLAEICPSVVQEEYPRFLRSDKKLFEDLFGQVINVPA